MTELKLLIDGEWVDSAEGESFAVIDPATGEIVARAQAASPEDASRAVSAAHKAFAVWSKETPQFRGSILKRAAQLARSRSEELGRLLTLEQGKPLREAVGEILSAADALEYFGEQAWRILGDVFPPNRKGRMNLVLKQPLGVVVAISPWNYPVLLLSWKLGPALVAGNTVVVKPPTEAPVASTLFAALIQEAGAPPGTINVVTGRGNRIGPTLITHPLTAKIAFTGETKTGKEIMALASKGLKRLSLELGNSTPLLVFPDAHLEAAAKAAAYRSFRNAGQICNAVNRIFVHQEVLEPFLEFFLENVRKIVVGPGLQNPDMGPLCTEEGIRRTQAHVQDALDRGAKLLFGGRRLRGEVYDRGFFYEPTVLLDVPPESLLMREETFGPVAPISTFSSLEEAIALANSTPYGLVAYAFTRDLGTLWALGEALEFGTVGINNVVGGEFPYPYAGWKESGFGVENSPYAVEGYLQLKHLRIDLEG
jgi:succinate-semialdehyde dehydrogenase/glutarate-semialdehyde dehydrogenase